MIFQTQMIWSNRIHSLKYLSYATFGSKDIVIRKSEFVAKTQFLCLNNKIDRILWKNPKKPSNFSFGWILQNYKSKYYKNDKYVLKHQENFDISNSSDYKD